VTADPSLAVVRLDARDVDALEADAASRARPVPEAVVLGLNVGNVRRRRRRGSGSGGGRGGGVRGGGGGLDGSGGGGGRLVGGGGSDLGGGNAVLRGERNADAHVNAGVLVVVLVGSLVIVVGRRGRAGGNEVPPLLGLLESGSSGKLTGADGAGVGDGGVVDTTLDLVGPLGGGALVVSTGKTSSAGGKL
jgi:hypothetical protein